MSGPGSDMTQRLMVPRIMFLALLMSVFIYVFIGWFMLKFGDFQPAGVDPMIRYVLAGTGVTMVFMSYVMRIVVLGGGKSSEYQAGRDYSPPSPDMASPGALEIDAAVFGKFQTATMIGLVLCESCAIFGLVVFFLSGDIVIPLALTGVSVLGMLGHFPRAGTLIEMQRKMGGGG